MKTLKTVAFAACFASLVSCGGGGGGGGANPAPSPKTPSLNIDPTGVWICTAIDLVDTNTRYAEPLYELGRAFSIADGIVEQWRRVDIELVLGFSVDWHVNNAGGRTVEFGVGWDRLGDPTSTGDWVAYDQMGVRLAAVGPNTLEGYQSEVIQAEPGSPRGEWTYLVRFERLGGARQAVLEEPEEPRWPRRRGAAR